LKSLTSFPNFPRKIVVAGIDTDAGKTLVSALFCLGLNAGYWKPVQAGLLPHTDTEWVKATTALTHSHFYPEAYRFFTPASPHFAAEAESIRIEEAQIQIPDHSGHLVIEGAGGLMVPLRKDFLYLDLLETWKLPVLLVVRTYLGSINHSLLSIEALKRRGIPIAGLVFNDGPNPDAIASKSSDVISEYSGIPVLGRLRKMDVVDRESLLRLWEKGFAAQVASLKFDSDFV
jgi:dethiobiotin synthetase